MNVRTPFAIAAAVVLVIAAATGAFYVVAVKAPSDLARKTAAGVREFFNFTPQVRINQTIVIEQTTPILEVATVSREMLIDHSWEQTWLRSTKTMVVFRNDSVDRRLQQRNRRWRIFITLLGRTRWKRRQVRGPQGWRVTRTSVMSTFVPGVFVATPFHPPACGSHE